MDFTQKLASSKDHGEHITEKDCHQEGHKKDMRNSRSSRFRSAARLLFLESHLACRRRRSSRDQIDTASESTEVDQGQIEAQESGRSYIFGIKYHPNIKFRTASTFERQNLRPSSIIQLVLFCTRISNRRKGRE